MNIIKRKSCQVLANHRRNNIILSVMLCIIPISALAESAQELSQLAHSYLLSHLDPQLKQPNVQIRPLSVVAQKPKCQTPVEIRFNGNQRIGNVNLTLSCEQPRWQQYVSAIISGNLPVIVARKDIMSGQAILPEDVQREWRPHTQITNNHLTQLDALTYKSSRQYIAAGSIIMSNQIKASVVIHQNDQVHIIANEGSIHIEMDGIALDAGEIGKAIRVKNLTSGKIIKAYVQSADTVIVN